MNADLERRIREVLAKLATLSEVSAASMEPRTSAGAPQSQLPPGTDESLGAEGAGSGPPSKDRSLADWYAWQFANKADDPYRTMTLLLLAERDYLARTNHVPHRVALRQGDHTDDEANGARVVDWYEGMPDLEVAVLEYCSPAWVRKVREQRGRRPDDGRVDQGRLFRDAADEDRRRMVSDCKARGLGQKRCADELGVSKGTVQRYWPREERVAA